MSKELKSRVYAEAEIKFSLSPLSETALILPLDELFQALECCPFADSLRASNRFKQRFYFPQYGDTDEVWVKWVEPFTSLIQHQTDFAQWSIAFHSLEADRFSSEEQMLGILADAIHDLGEAKIDGQEFVGDIASGIKTSSDEVRETVVAHAAIDAIDLKDSTRALLHQAYDEVVVGKNEKLHKAHKAREKWDYVRTCLHLYSLANTEETFYTESPIYSLDWFITRILAYDLPKITRELAREYPGSIGHQLKINEKLIDGAFVRAQAHLYQLAVGTRETKIEDNYIDLQRKLDASCQLLKVWLNNNQTA